MDDQNPEHDWIWDSVLEAMSEAGVIGDYHKLSPVQIQNLMKVEGRQVANDLAIMFRLTKEKDFERRKLFMKTLRREKLICVMFLLSRSIRWWFESGHGDFKAFQPKFPIAHA